MLTKTLFVYFMGNGRVLSSELYLLPYYRTRLPILDCVASNKVIGIELERSFHTYPPTGGDNTSREFCSYILMLEVNMKFLSIFVFCRVASYIGRRDCT